MSKKVCRRDVKCQVPEVGLNSEVPYREKKKRAKRRGTPGNKAGSKQFVKEPNPPKAKKPQHKMSEAVEVEQIIETKPRKMALPTSLDKEAIREAYEDIRSNLTDNEWAVFKFDGLKIVCAAKGLGFDEFCAEFADNERAFGYIRIQMGDEMSKRSKFLFLTWIGPEVGVMQRAKMSTDKSIIKDVINNFAVELQVETSADLNLEMFKEHLNKAGGANYGTGVREL